MLLQTSRTSPTAAASSSTRSASPACGTRSGSATDPLCRTPSHRRRDRPAPGGPQGHSHEPVVGARPRVPEELTRATCRPSLRPASRLDVDAWVSVSLPSLRAGSAGVRYREPGRHDVSSCASSMLRRRGRDDSRHRRDQPLPMQQSDQRLRRTQPAQPVGLTIRGATDDVYPLPSDAIRPDPRRWVDPGISAPQADRRTRRHDARTRQPGFVEDMARDLSEACRDLEVPHSVTFRNPRASIVTTQWPDSHGDEARAPGSVGSNGYVRLVSLQAEDCRVRQLKNRKPSAVARLRAPRRLRDLMKPEDTFVRGHIKGHAGSQRPRDSALAELDVGRRDRPSSRRPRNLIAMEANPATESSLSSSGSGVESAEAVSHRQRLPTLSPQRADLPRSARPSACVLSPPVGRWQRCPRRTTMLASDAAPQSR